MTIVILSATLHRMDSPPSRKEVTHERIVATAARAIRRGGFHGVGVADIMKEAGLTHGGFYAHFSSRNALLAEALERAGQDSAARVTQGIAARQARGASPLRALVEGYLSDRHLGELEAKRAPDRRLQATGEQRLELLQPVQQAFGLIHGDHRG